MLCRSARKYGLECRSFLQIAAGLAPLLEIVYIVFALFCQKSNVLQSSIFSVLLLTWWIIIFNCQLCLQWEIDDQDPIPDNLGTVDVYLN